MNTTDDFPICIGCDMGMEAEEVIAMTIGGAPLCWSCVELGRGEPRPCTFRVTNAPESYDGFGTVTVELYEQGFRRVQIDVDALEWQTTRYQSGMYGVATDDDFQQAIAVRRPA